MFKLVFSVFKKLLLIAGLLLVIVGFLFYRYLQSPLVLPEQGVDYSLKPGSSLSAMAYDLERQQILNYPKLFLVFSRLAGLAQQVQAGEYVLEYGLTPLSLLAKLQRGDVKTYQLTFVEGWRLSELLRFVSTHNKLINDVDLENDYWFQQRQKELGYDSFEGMFFPDTYQFAAGISGSQLLKIAYQRMQAVLEDEWQTRADNLPYKNAYEALIMASLIEKETGVASERATIAGVFVRRLQLRMRLQTDPTVIYGLGENFDGNLRSRHLKDSSNRHNTYRHHGLPPTPIALVGREAIHAALHPEPGDVLYFVAKGDGSHYFSATLEEHSKAVRQYQIYRRRENYRSAPKQ